MGGLGMLLVLHTGSGHIDDDTVAACSDYLTSGFPRGNATMTNKDYR